LVAALVADPERPWAEWKHGKPLSQNQLARLLKPFVISSETVHPAGRPHAKGYTRASFDDAWARYLMGQNTSSPADGASDPCKRARADETGIASDLRSVRDKGPHESKDADLYYSHAGLHAGTDRKPTHAESENGTADHRCDYCGRLGATRPYDWPGRPDGIWLHPRCEGPWYDSKGPVSR